VNFHITAKNMNDRKSAFISSATKPLDMKQNNSLTLINSFDGLLAIEAQWRELESKNAIPATVFQSFEWIKCWCETHLENDELQIFSGYQSGQLVFVFPLIKSIRHGIKTLQWLTEPLGQYGDVLCAHGQDPAIWMAVAIDAIKTSKSIDVIRLRHIRKDSVSGPFVDAHMVDAKYYERAPFLDLTTFKTEVEYDARYTPTQRKRRKKIRKSLEEKGVVSFGINKPGAAGDAAITQAIAEKNAWLTDRGRFNRVMGCSKHIAFLKTLSRSKSDSFAMVTSELKAGGKPVSWEIGFQYRGTHFAYITSHVNALTDLSPGRLHMDLSQRAALAAGQKRFDLMVPYDVHKESWSSATVDTNDYYFPVTTFGKIYGAFYLRTIRPIIRKIYYKLPQPALRLLQACCPGYKP
jgi:CelD/BcsL family acetyltransferase involved in cellulose biosynthesis